MFTADPRCRAIPMTADHMSSAESAESPQRGRGSGIALLVIASCQLMVVLDITIVNIALPHIQTSLGFSTENLSWVINAYTLTFGGLLLLGGRSGDILGRRRVFMFGVVLFALASLLGGLSQESWQLLAARSLQGVGGAIASPTALALITTTFREGPERNRAFGVFAAVSAGGSAIGLLAGGILVEWLDWRWVFFVNIPIGLLIVLATPATSRSPSATRATSTSWAPSPPRWAWCCSSTASSGPRRRAGATPSPSRPSGRHWCS